jgi:hypothetical protein
MLSLDLRPAKPQMLVETSMLREAIDRTLHFHSSGGGIILWQGTPGVGMTTSALCLVQRSEQTCLSGEPGAFRALYYTVGHCSVSSGDKVKQALRTLYQAASQTSLDYEAFRKTSTEGLAVKLVTELMKENKQILLLDEVSGVVELFVRAARLVLSVARAKRWPLSFVLINSSYNKPNIQKCISALPYTADDLIQFRGLGLKDTWVLLRAFLPLFEEYNHYSSGGLAEQVEFIHHECQGMPAQLVLFIRRIDFMLGRNPTEINLNWLRAIKLCFELDKPIQWRNQPRSQESKDSSTSSRRR